MNQDVFKQMLKEKKLKVTSQRLLILELIAKHPGEHLTAEEIYDLAKENFPEIGLATIYRTLQVLVELKVIDKISFDDGYARYELGQVPGSKKHHHHHAICRQCGRVFPFEEDLLDTLEQSLMDCLGFSVTDHEVKLYGYCKACRSKRDKEEQKETKEDKKEGSKRRR